jgi:hypothetical protein
MASENNPSPTEGHDSEQLCDTPKCGKYATHVIVGLSEVGYACLACLPRYEDPHSTIESICEHHNTYADEDIEGGRVYVCDECDEVIPQYEDEDAAYEAYRDMCMEDD